MQRRSFLKGFAALAACAVAGPTLAALQKDDTERLIAAMKTGYIEGQHFVFTRPIVIDFSNLKIHNCTFTFKCPYRMEAAVTIKGNGIEITNSHFDAGANGADYGISVIADGRKACYFADNCIDLDNTPRRLIFIPAY